MARSNSHRLGNNLDEIQFFSKDVDYDKEFYETHFLEKDEIGNDGSENVGTQKPLKNEDLIKIWELEGPVRILPLPGFDFDVYPLYFTNFQKFDYFQLKELLGNFFTLCEFKGHKVRVTYKIEDDLRAGYRALKKDKRYNLRIILDGKNHYQKHKNNFGNNNFNPSNNKTGLRLVNRWINNDDIVIETNKSNCFPIQIKNYKEYSYDELMELFSKYGKFTSIAQFENEYVQVKFCTEEAARNCIIDLKKDKNYNVRLLFFLKELNKGKKLVKEIASAKSDTHVMQLLEAEERIKFDPNQAPVKKKLSRVNGKNKNQEKQKAVSTPQIDHNITYYRKNFENGNIYIHGTPLENPFLSPTYTYKVWKNKQNHLPPPPPENSNDISNDENYKYCLKSVKALGYHSHTCCFDDAR